MTPITDGHADRATPLNNRATPPNNRGTPPNNRATPPNNRATPLNNRATPPNKNVLVVMAAAALASSLWAVAAADSSAAASAGAVAPAPMDALDGIATQLSLPPAAAAAMRSIDAGRIRADVRFLADDLLEGRGTGTRGGDIAARYIATQFALDGLEPAGDDGSYFQTVRFTGVHTLPSTSLALQPAQGPAQPLRLNEDYVTSNQTQTEHADIDAPIVFVGYGIDAPEYQWNDYRGIDVKGKVVLVLVNEPPSKDPKFFNGPKLTYYGRWTYKFEAAARQGAIGALIIHRTDLASYGFDVVRNSWSGEAVYLRDDAAPRLAAASWIGFDVARRLFASAGLDVDTELARAGTRKFVARELPVRLRGHVDSTVREFQSSNVLGLLPGSDTGSARQAVVYSAHYDHLGLDPNLTGDQIYNGAVDNGTGCAMLLELAHAFASSGSKPAHPILFVSVTAEEKGLLGSRYLGQHLPIAPGRIALDLNFDAVAPVGMPESVTVTGAERTSFYPVVAKTAAAFGFEIQPDSEPGAGHYYRSDHFSFARAGVPAFSVGTGLKFAGHSVEWGKERRDDYTANRYHHPADEYNDAMDFSSNVALARFGYALGVLAEALPDGVQWLPGDEFEAERKRGEQ
jgi:Zn-dependent M28 family amino/carboxypeptidase